MRKSYYINNPSAWQNGFDQTISDELSRLENEKAELLSVLKALSKALAVFNKDSQLLSDIRDEIAKMEE